MLRKLWVGLIRFGFRLLYYELAWTYDWVSWLVSLGEWRRWQQAALPFVEGPRVLEIGHGPGHMLLAMQAAGHQIIGVDLSPHMGRQARRRLRKKKLPANLARAKVQSLPFETAVFHTVLSTFPTDYIVDLEALTAIHRVLKANGRLIVVPEGHLTGRGGLHQLIDWLFRITGQRGGPFSVYEAHNWPHPDLWEPFRQRFVAAGLHVNIKQIQLERSAVTIFIAEKSAAQVKEDVIMEFPQSAKKWQETIEAGLGITAVQGQQQWASNNFPSEKLAAWLAKTYDAKHGYSPQFVPALLRNLRGLLAWTYGNGDEPYWPGSDANSQT